MTQAFGRIGIVVVLAVCTASALGQSAPVSQPVTEMHPTAPDDVAVTVNGHRILESAVTELVKARMPRDARGAPSGAIREVLRGQVIDELIEGWLLDEELARAKTQMTEEEYAAKTRAELEGYLALNALTRAEFGEQLRAERGKSLDAFLAERQADPARRQTLLRNKFIAAKFPEDARVTEENAREYYQTQRDRHFAKPERVRASQILISTGGMTDEQKAAARKHADTVLTEVRKPGADFAAFAAQHATEPAKSKGGDLGYFPRSGVMPEEIAAAAFALKVGEISDVIETKAGFHILKVTDRQPAAVLPFEQAKPGILAQLEEQKLQSAQRRYGIELRKTAEIVFPPGKRPGGGRSAQDPVATTAPTTRPH